MSRVERPPQTKVWDGERPHSKVLAVTFNIFAKAIRDFQVRTVSGELINAIIASGEVTSYIAKTPEFSRAVALKFGGDFSDELAATVADKIWKNDLHRAAISKIIVQRLFALLVVGQR